jgi:hypothetical protein
VKKKEYASITGVREGQGLHAYARGCVQENRNRAETLRDMIPRELRC